MNDAGNDAGNDAADDDGVPAAGARVGAYRVLRTIGRGGMGVLSLAMRDDDDTPVVLKRPLAGRPQAHALALARREAAIASALQHPGVVRVVDLLHDNGVPVLVMEHLLGLSLRDVGRHARRAGTPLPLEAVLDAMAQAARALHYVHTLRDDDGRPRGLVHRDVAPDNLFLTGDGAVKLLDFGVARADDLEELTTFGSLKGKRGYFAPELLQGHPPDPRTDLFALGVTLHWLLCGRLPWRARDPGPAFVEMMSAPAPPPSLRNPFVPPAVDALVADLVAIDRARRLADGAAVADRIDELLRRVASGARSARRLLLAVGVDPRTLSAQALDADTVATTPAPGPPERERGASNPTRHAPGQSAADAVLASAEARAHDGAHDAGDDDDADDDADGDGRSRDVGSRPIRRWDADGASTFALRPDDDVALPEAPTAALPRAPGPPAPRAPADTASPATTARPGARPGRVSRTRRAPVVLGAALGTGVVLAVVLAVVLGGRAGERAAGPSTEHATEATRAPATTLAEARPAPTTTPAPASTTTASPTTASPTTASPTTASPTTATTTTTAPAPTPPAPNTGPADDAPRGNDDEPASRPRVATERVVVRGPDRIRWSAGGRPLRNGPGVVVLAAGTRAVQGRDPRRDVVSPVPVVDGAADWDALPRVSLLLRARPWASVRLGEEELGQTPLQPVRVVPGRYRVRFENGGRVVVRTVDVQAGAEAVKVNVDMDADR